MMEKRILFSFFLLQSLSFAQLNQWKKLDRVILNLTANPFPKLPEAFSMNIYL
jgi:hypothetical protein